MRSAVRRLLLSSLALLAACGAPAAAPPALVAGPTTVIATETEILVSLGAAPAVPPQGVEAPPERVLAALQQVYAELEIPGAASDPASRTVGTPTHLLSRTLAKERTGDLLDCGRTTSGERAADVYRVRGAVRTTVASWGGTGSSVRTVVEGTARSNEGWTGGEVRCVSTGRLEARIAALLRQRLEG